MTFKTDRASTDTIGAMKAFFIVLVVANVLVFSLGQGWFGTKRSDAGRQPGLLQTQLNSDALNASRGQLQAR